MAREITDIKQFLEIARRKDARAARMKRPVKGPNQIKFKIRCHRHLYTLILKDANADKADKIKQSLPPGLKFEEVGKKTKKAKKS